MKLKVTVTLDMDKVAELADAAIPASGAIELASDMAIEAALGSLSKVLPRAQGLLKERLGDYATLHVETDE